MKSTSGMQLARMLPLTGVMLLSAGWSNTLNAPKDDSAASQALVERHDLAAKEGSYQINLNLANKTDWDFLRNRLASAGKTEQNAPELFRRMGLIRERALARQASGTLADDPRNGAWCNHFLKFDRAHIPDGNVHTFFPVVQVSCKDGADYVYADLLNYDTHETESDSVLHSSTSGEEYGDGREFDDVKIPATIATGRSRVLRMESLALALGTTIDQTSYIVERAAVINTLPSMTFTHPRKILPAPVSAEIMACQLRGGLDCDYAVAGYQNGNLTAYPPSPTGVAASYSNQPGTLNPSDFWSFTAPYQYDNLYVPVRGTFNAGASNGFQCTLASVAMARVQLITNDSARTCLNNTQFISSLPTGGTQVFLNILTNMNRLFNTAGNGTSPADCAASTVINEMTRLLITISGKVRCNGVDKPFVVIYPKQPEDGTPNIFFRNSCMASGTRITLADGTVVPVETVKLGDKVLANDKGTALTVIDVSRGNEVKPLLRLRDDAGHDATLTEMHPVIMATGEVVAAKALKVQDQVKTAKGISTLTSITPVSPEKQRVYNLGLGTDQERLTLEKNGRTLFAGGFLVGDLGMQDVLQRPLNEQKLSLLERLPKAWHRDFRNGIQPKVAH